MNRAALANEPAAELLQHAVGLDERVPEASDRVDVVRGMHRVVVEPDRVRDFVGPRVANLRRHANRAQCVEIATIEFRHRQRLERQGRLSAVAGAHDEQVAEQIEVDLERPILVGHRRRGQATRRDVKR